MPKLTKPCPVCGKISESTKRQLVDSLGFAIVHLSCGHSYTEKIEKSKPWEELETYFGRKDKLFHFQGAG
jgi:hypothetical protein